MPATAQPSGIDMPIPPHVRRQAANWVVALQSDDATDDTLARWRQWREGHPDHERAWQRIESFGSRLAGLPSPLAHAALAAPNREGRRRAVKALAGLFVVGGTAWWLDDATPWRPWTADRSTGIGERAEVRLADGTLVQMNAGSAIDVHFSAQARVVRLLAGEILVTTSQDPLGDAESGRARPFLVDTPQGRLRALGTRFCLHLPDRSEDGDCQVAVFDGAVEIRPVRGDDRPLILYAGQRGYFNRDVAVQDGLADDGDLAWLQGMIVARDMPLQGFLSRLSQYRRGWVDCDPAVAALRVSGTYPLSDTDRILDMLAATLPVRVQFTTRYWVTVKPAQRGA
ncbi:regulator of iron dicitrate transport [Bordetella ansorpii]|uniref:Regulator of iron dicitrate transport n=1 Tax=Bordetella ansorpii TaxID=288768 RepID=A0A157SAN6_9BORD|nr:FecR domain-containing protein [Bordetella ansorpii]SAI67478.1 regulator of iron dicitrate transport [Bordetella ansorpii]